jgi:hypothetical protein
MGLVWRIKSAAKNTHALAHGATQAQSLGTRKSVYRRASAEPVSGCFW